MPPKRRSARPIPEPVPSTSVHLRFSFEFYDTSQDKYCLSHFTPDQVRETLARLKQVNENTLNELRQKKMVYHFHSVDWSTTTEPGGFPDRRLDELEPFQFALLNVNQQRARVYGAISGDTFFIVWFDLHHQITPSYKKHT